MTCMTKNSDADISEKGKNPKQYFIGTWSVNLVVAILIEK